ncbi:hypothetical protein BJV77DRAFT_451936 [Russula vinacea]|nr:hypothetical protein BJV77DRAFT_451936 [Russula vinacea]
MYVAPLVLYSLGQLLYWATLTLAYGIDLLLPTFHSSLIVLFAPHCSLMGHLHGHVLQHYCNSHSKRTITRHAPSACNSRGPCKMVG